MFFFLDGTYIVILFDLTRLNFSYPFISLSSISIYKLTLKKFIASLHFLLLLDLAYVILIVIFLFEYFKLKIIFNLILQFFLSLKYGLYFLLVIFLFRMIYKIDFFFCDFMLLHFFYRV